MLAARKWTVKFTVNFSAAPNVIVGCVVFYPVSRFWTSSCQYVFLTSRADFVKKILASESVVPMTQGARLEDVSSLSSFSLVIFGAASLLSSLLSLQAVRPDWVLFPVTRAVLLLFFRFDPQSVSPVILLNGNASTLNSFSIRFFQRCARPCL